jgi:hypothetical protein
LRIRRASDKIGAHLNNQWWALRVCRAMVVQNECKGNVQRLTLVPIISSTLLWMSWSVMRLMWPLRTFLSQISSGLDLSGLIKRNDEQWGENGNAAYPMLYKIDKNPDWKVFLNMAQEANLTDKVECNKRLESTIPFPTLLQ